jgi:hypothetical protein
MSFCRSVFKNIASCGGAGKYKGCLKSVIAPFMTM